MKVLVTGHNGFIGNALSRYLERQKGWEVLNPEGSWRGEYDSTSSLNLSNGEELQAYLNAEKPDLIVNTASRKGSDYCDKNLEDTLKSNIDGTRNLISSCNKLQLPVIHFGTTAYYFSDERPIPINEKSDMSPRTVYGWTKMGQVMMFENMATFPWMVVEPVFLYGNIDEFEQGRSESVPDLLVKLLKDPTFPDVTVRISPKWVKDYTHIGDFVWMLEKIMKNPVWGERVTVGAGYNQRFGKVATEILNKVNSRIKFDEETDYKKHQVHNYSHLLDLYPDARSRPWLSLGEFWSRYL